MGILKDYFVANKPHYILVVRTKENKINKYVTGYSSPKKYQTLIDMIWCFEFGGAREIYLEYFNKKKNHDYIRRYKSQKDVIDDLYYKFGENVQWKVWFDQEPLHYSGVEHRKFYK